jgi:hypothetical protein
MGQRQNDKYSLQGHTLLTFFLQLGSTS